MAIQERIVQQFQELISEGQQVLRAAVKVQN